MLQLRNERFYAASTAAQVASIAHSVRRVPEWAFYFCIYLYAAGAASCVHMGLHKEHIRSSHLPAQGGAWQLRRQIEIPTVLFLKSFILFVGRLQVCFSRSSHPSVP